MKTRIFHTEFWLKMAQKEVPDYVRYLYAYLALNDHIGMSNIYELPDQYILLETGLTKSKLEKAKTYLTEKHKVYFYEGWVDVVEAEKFNNYKASPKNKNVYEQELNDIPIVVSNYFKQQEILVSEVQIVVSRVPDSTHKSEIINNKSKTINQKEEINKEEKGIELLRKKTKEIGLIKTAKNKN